MKIGCRFVVCGQEFPVEGLTVEQLLVIGWLYVTGVAVLFGAER